MGWQNAFAVIFQAGNTIINPQGMFVYSSSPAFGNLVASSAGTAGTDKFGNPYAAGDKVYGTDASSVNIRPSSGGNPAAVAIGSGDVAESTPASLTSGIFGAPASTRFIQTILSTARVSGQNALSNLQVILEGESVDHTFGNDLRIEGSSQTGAEGFRVQLTAVDGSSSMLFSGTGVAGNMLIMDVTNKRLVAGYPVFAATTAGGPTPETWTAISPNAGFTAANSLGYKLNADNTVSLRGEVITSANNIANASVFTLPAGRRPSTPVAYLTPNNLSGYTAPARVVSISTAGVISVAAAGTSGNFFLVDDIRFQVD